MERSGDVKTRLLGAREMCQRSVMSKLVAHGATLACSQGTAPSRLAVPPVTGIDDEAGPLATVQDVKPLVNIAPFGACRALANPQVALATAAALGVLTPQPCVPVTAAPWSPGSAVVRVDDVPALTDACTCACAWAGTVSVKHPGCEGLEDG